MSLVTLRSYRDPIDAEIARARLEGAGVPAFVFDQYVVGVQWLYSRAIGGVKVKVERGDLARATQVLREDRSSDVSEEGASTDPTDLCPACGSPDAHHSRVQRNAAALSLLTSLPFIAWRRRWVCDRCGHSWRPARTPRSEVPAETLAAEEQVREASSHPMLRVFFAALLGLAILYYVETRIRSSF
jgi:Putative prokaryotic signal transducing protein